jgi:hypothetical protein
MFICLSGVSDAKFATPGALMCGGIGAGVAPSQACQTRWIGRWFRRLCEGGQSAGKRTSNSRSRSVDKVSSVDVAHKRLNELLLLTGNILGEQSSVYGLLAMPERHAHTITEP